MKRMVPFALVWGWLFLFTGLSLQAEVTNLFPVADTTIYEVKTGATNLLSNGAGENLFAGVAGPSNFNRIMRGLVRFDPVASVPADSVVTSAVLRLTLNTPNLHTGTIRLHRVEADWGEGASDAITGEAAGADPVAPDATWTHRRFDTDDWAVAGGDFNAVSSAEIVVVDNTNTMAFSSPQLIADVQDMLDNPAGNFGWILVHGDEASPDANAVRFLSRENIDIASRPQLVVGHQAAGPAPDSRLVGLWQFEDEADLGKDSSLFSNHLEAFGNVVGNTNGAIGAAVELGGGVADFLGLAGDPGPGTDHFAFPTAIPTNNSYTISAWLKPDQPAAINDAMIAWGNFGVQNQVVAFRMNGTGGLINYWWSNDLSVNTGGVNLKDGEWHHAVAVYIENSLFGSDQFIYLDGVLLGQRNGNNALAALPENFRLGSANANGETFDGQLDDIAVFDYGMNEAEVNFLFTGDYGAFTNHAASYWTGPFGTNGTWNLYQVVGHDYGAVETWAGAHGIATNSVDPLGGSGKLGHLVSIANQAENDFVLTIKPRNVDIFIGLTDDPAFGGTQAGNDPDGGWVWAGTAEPFSYQNFAGGQPDNSGDAVTMWQDAGTWDDTVVDGPQRVYIIEWDVEAAGAIAGARMLPEPPPLPPPVLPPVLPGPEGEDGAFGGIWVRDNGTLDSLAAATNSLLSGTGTILTTNRIPVVNHHDPEKPGDIDRVLFPDEGPYWANIVGAPDDHFAAVYKGHIVIPADGNYTFGVHSDDGFGLRVSDANFFNLNGAGSIDLADRSTIYFPVGTGDSNTRGSTFLTGGVHRIEFVAWNGAGGAYHELYAAPGVRAADDRLAFDLVGAPAGVAEIPGLTDTNVWDVWMTNPGVDGGIGDTNTAWNALSNYLPAALGGSQPDPLGSNHFTYAEINFGNGNQGSVGGDNPYPVPGNANFAVFARTFITITNAGVYVMGFQGDDGGWMRVVGQNWDELVVKQVATAYIEGDKIALNAATGNSRMFGTMTLGIGTYEVQMLNWQGGGGFQLEALNGVYLDRNKKVISGLFDNVAESMPYSGGLQLVAPPGSADLLITDIIYDPLADSITVTFDSVASASYKLVYSVDNSPGADFDPQNWADLATGIGSAGASTSVLIPDFFGTPWRDLLDDFFAIRVAEE